MKNIKLLLLTFTLLSAFACKKDCQEKATGTGGCETVYRPVCGCNNKTYGNPCEAEAWGITNYTAGICK